MNVLVIAPHPDDESIGCGGTICLHADRGDRVAAVFLTSGERGLTDRPEKNARRVRELESEDAAAILGISSITFLRFEDQHLGEDIGGAAQALKPILEREHPEVIYLPHERDFHPDHRASVSIVQTAVSTSGITRLVLLSYEILTPLTEYDRAEDITLVMQRKLKAVCAHRSQVRQFRYDRALRAMNRYRGIVARAGRYAEVFRFANGCMSGIPQACRANPGWHRLYAATQEIIKVVPPEASFVLVDDGRLEASALFAPRRCMPFLEKDGRYWGKPPDDATAIRELERLRGIGASFIVFVSSTFWWLDYYSGLYEYLQQFSCIRQDERIVVFDLRTRNSKLVSMPKLEYAT
jgi:N-acetylglucosamine malate deacetylase 1